MEEAEETVGEVFVSKLDKVTRNLFTALVVKAVVRRVKVFIKKGCKSLVCLVKGITTTLAKTNVNIKMTEGLRTRRLIAIYTTIINVVKTFTKGVLTNRILMSKGVMLIKPNRPLKTFITTCITVRVKVLIAKEAGLSVVLAPLVYVNINTIINLFIKPPVSSFVG